MEDGRCSTQPDAAQALCSDGKMATSVQEFCTSIAWTRGSREAAAQRTRRAAERNENGHENTEDGEVEENESKTEHEVDAVVR